MAERCEGGGTHTKSLNWKPFLKCEGGGAHIKSLNWKSLLNFQVWRGRGPHQEPNWKPLLNFQGERGMKGKGPTPRA